MRESVKIGGVGGGTFLLGAIAVFAAIAFPPLAFLLILAAGLLALRKWSRRRQARRGARAHRAKMDQFYFEQEWRDHQFTNPGWRL